MITFERVKGLADKQKISIVELEEKLGFSRNSLYSWKKNKPSIDKLNAVADYFGVTTDYLLGRTNSTNPLETKNENASPEYFAIQRKSKKLSQKDQKKLLKIMEITFDEIDAGDFEEDDMDDDL